MFDYIAALPPEAYDAIGIAGFGLYVLNYSLLTFQRLRAEQVSYFVLNWLAASMVLVGLFNAFNLASALIQIFWIVISTVGIIIRIKQRAIPPTTFETNQPAA